MTIDEIAHSLQRSMNGSFMKLCLMSGPVFTYFILSWWKWNKL